MPSYIGWLDYNEQERQRTLDVIDLFREHDTRDELGIGTVRDALADLLFPGTTTIQTRARYFLFVPWVMRDLERRRVPSSRAASDIRSQEIALINSLVNNGEPEGVIGSSARDSLKRLPSSVYWQGMAAWGIRLFSGSIAQYVQSLDAHYRLLQRKQSADDGAPMLAVRSNWHSGLPDLPDGFPRTPISLKLPMPETLYLREQITSNLGASLLSYLIDFQEDLPLVDFPWEVIDIATLPPILSEQVFHARNFSLVMHGASLLYNLMLAEQTTNPELIDYYRGMLADWIATVDSHDVILSTWNNDAFWRLIDSISRAPVSIQTRGFINAWLGRCMQTLSNLVDDPQLRQLIREREWALKHNQARLISPRALELWTGSAGTSRLDFRWRTVRQIISDIREGLATDDLS